MIFKISCYNKLWRYPTSRREGFLYKLSDINIALYRLLKQLNLLNGQKDIEFMISSGDNFLSLKKPPEFDETSFGQNQILSPRSYSPCCFLIYYSQKQIANLKLYAFLNPILHTQLCFSALFYNFLAI